TQHFYDAMNRDTLVRRYRDPQAHPGGINPLATCRTSQSTCATSLPDTVPQSWASSLPTRAVHNARGALTSVVDPRGVTRGYKADARGLAVRETDEAGAHRYAYYSLSGLLDSTKSQSGKVVRYSYDALGRVTEVRAPSVSHSVKGT